MWRSHLQLRIAIDEHCYSIVVSFCPTLECYIGVFLIHCIGKKVVNSYLSSNLGQYIDAKSTYEILRWIHVTKYPLPLSPVYTKTSLEELSFLSFSGLFPFIILPIVFVLPFILS